MRVLGLLLCGVVAAVGCGDDSAGDGGGAGSSCYEVCDAQVAAEAAGNCMLFTAAECKGICDAVTDCRTELSAMHDCWLTGTFSCGLFSAESDAECSTEEDAYNSCAAGGGSGSGGGGGAAACTGADENGRCPQVPCACPDGEQRISGSESTGGGCACLTADTCTDLCF